MKSIVGIKNGIEKAARNPATKSIAGSDLSIGKSWLNCTLPVLLRLNPKRNAGRLLPNLASLLTLTVGSFLFMPL